MESKFKYKAVDEAGALLQGAISANSEAEAVNLLRARGIKTIKINTVEEKSADIDILSSPKLSLNDLILFCRQTSTMLNAGMALNRCLDVLISQSSKKKVRKTVTGVATDIQKGESLTYALKVQHKSFPGLLINTVEAGEMTGQLGEVLEKMAIYYEKEKKIRSKIKGAMMYPMVLTFVTVLSTTILLVGVMPKFMKIFESTGVEFPALTKFVISISKVLTNYGIFVILGVVLMVVAFKKMLLVRSTRVKFDAFKLRVPVVKGPMKRIVTARFTRTLSTMLSSGISVIPAILASAQNVQNAYVEERLQHVVLGIEKGMGMTEQLEKAGVFPPMMLSMIGIGEESGNLTGMLEKTADYYDEELEAALQQMVSLIEPLMILVMAVVIGTIVIAMYLPMFEAFKTLQ